MLKEKRIIATVTNPLFHDKRMIRICRSLANQGALVSLWGVKKPDVPQPVPQNFSQKLIAVPFKKGFLFYASYNILLFFRLLFTRFDLAIAVDLDTLTAVSLACRIRHKPWVYDAHEYFTEVPELEGRPFVKWVWSLAAQFIGAHNMTVSESLALELSKKYKRKFEFIRNVPPRQNDTERSARSIDPHGDINIVYFGYLNEGRGLETALKALVMLPPRYKMILIGGGDLFESLIALAEELQIRHRVDFTGWVGPDESEAFLRSAHIGLNLLDGTSKSYYFSLANKTFDYLHLGIPAIHMDFPEYRMLGDEYNCVTLISELDPLVLSKAIMSIAENPVNYNDLSQNALLAAEELCWENEEDKLVDFVNRVMDKDSASNVVNSG